MGRTELERIKELLEQSERRFEIIEEKQRTIIDALKSWVEATVDQPEATRSIIKAL